MTLHGSLDVPVPVPFTECGNWGHLFNIVFKERGLAVETRRKFEHLTTGFLCTIGKFVGRLCDIRKGKRRDCDTIIYVGLMRQMPSISEVGVPLYRSPLIQTFDQLSLTFTSPLEEPYNNNMEMRMILIFMSPVLPA